MKLIQSAIGRPLSLRPAVGLEALAGEQTGLRPSVVDLSAYTDFNP